MSEKKIIVVTGSTGVQGGSVARFLLEDGKFAVRAITRDIQKPAAKELARKGAEVVQADLRNLESLKTAFEGAYGVFAVTNFWEPGVGSEGEILQGKNMVDAAKATGIKHFVWSTLDSSEFKPEHWESKAVVNEYLKASQVPRTSVYTSFYFENFKNFYLPNIQEDGNFSLFVPLITELPVAVYPACDMGGYVLAIFRNPQQWLSRDLRVASELLSVKDIGRIMTDISGKRVNVVEINEAAFEELTKTVPEEIIANMRVLQANGGVPFRDPELSRQVYPGALSFKEWLKIHKVDLFGK